MFSYSYWCVGIALILGSMAKGGIVVHEPNFVVDKLLDRIDGKTPRLEAISNPLYGNGIISANMNGGILTILRVNDSMVDVLGVHSGYDSAAVVLTVRFDGTGLYNNNLYATVAYGPDASYYENVITDILEVLEDGTISIKATGGNTTDPLCFTFDFTSSENGYLSGAYLEDSHVRGGTSLYHMDTDYTLTLLKQDWLPQGRTDMDVHQIQFDPTGLYGSYLTMADSDENNDNKTVIYQLDPNLSWHELTAPVTTQTRFYKDMCFSRGGSFQRRLYVTDTVSDTVMIIDPNGTHRVFASAFSGIESVTVSEDGEHMFVSDADAKLGN